MGIATKGLVMGSLAVSSILSGRFLYNEKKCRASLPQQKILIGPRSEKKAVIVGNYVILKIATDDVD